MKLLKQLFRLIYIIYILLKHGLDTMVLTTNWLRPLRFLILLSPAYWLNPNSKPRGQQIREALEELGPIFVKFGQLLSTRRDLLADDIAYELVKLQDRVPPFSSAQAIKTIEQAFGKKIAEIFATFDREPLASASIAQVHSATLLDGREVVVKVLRPNIDKQIRRDVELMLLLAKFLQRNFAAIKRFRPHDLVLEFKKSIFDELDLMREAANASQLKRNFTNSPLLYVPEVHWELTKTNVLVMERIYGIQVTNLPELIARKANLKLLAERGVEIFFTQVFRDCFFHADMHPGNVWVCVDDPNNPKYLALDFGIMGTLGPEDQRYLAENFLAFFKRDYRRVAELHIESGWVPATTRVDEFEAAIRCVCEPIFERPLKDISFGKTLLRLFQTAQRFNMEIQPQLLLLQKTLISVEGLGRQLYPDLDLWHTAKPFLETWMRKRLGAKAILKQLKYNGAYWLEKLPAAPHGLYKLIQHTMSKTNLQQILTNSQQLQRSQHQNSKLYGFLLGIAALSSTITCTVLFTPNIFSSISSPQAAIITALLAILSLGCAQFVRG